MGKKGKNAVRGNRMALVKIKGTEIEMWLRLRLHARGFRYRVNVHKLPGKPDIVLPKYKCVIFVNGCFGIFIIVIFSVAERKPRMVGGKTLQ